MTKSGTSIAITPIERRTPFQLAGTSQFDITSRRGRSYRIFVYEPPVAAPARGFPVLYFLDGNAMFATAVDVVTLQMRRSEVTGVPPSVVIGIGYPAASPLDLARRRFDYTPHGSGSQTDGGGADDFQSFLEEELKPAIEAMMPIDRERQALFGHSLGGLFVLYSLFNNPGLFQSYTAASPSIWWNDRSIVTQEAAFAERIRRSHAAIRLLVTVGGMEQMPRAFAGSASEFSVVEDAATLAERLQLLKSDRLNVSFMELPEETHVSVIPAAISRSIRCAWRDL